MCVAYVYLSIVGALPPIPRYERAYTLLSAVSIVVSYTFILRTLRRNNKKIGQSRRVGGRRRHNPAGGDGGQVPVETTKQEQTKRPVKCFSVRLLALASLSCK